MEKGRSIQEEALFQQRVVDLGSAIGIVTKIDKKKLAEEFIKQKKGKHDKAK